MTEKEQRWGIKATDRPRNPLSVESVKQQETIIKNKNFSEQATEQTVETKRNLDRSCSVSYNAGYGGKYGLQYDRVDKSAVGFDYLPKIEKHASQRGLFFQIKILSF